MPQVMLLLEIHPSTPWSASPGRALDSGELCSNPVGKSWPRLPLGYHLLGKWHWQKLWYPSSAVLSASSNFAFNSHSHIFHQILKLRDVFLSHRS